MLRVALAALAAALLAQAQAFHVETRLVVVHATVTDDRGALVTRLPASAFTVYENGVRQTIAAFRNDDVPASIGLLIDNSGSMRTKRASVEAAALAFAGASNPDDEMFVLNFADTSRIDVPFTSDIRVLESGIARVDSIGGTALRDAVSRAEEYVAEHARRDRKVLVLVSDGADNASTTPVERIRVFAEQHDVVVFAIGLLASSDPHAGSARHDLERLTRSSGGVAYFPASLVDVGDVALDVARQIRSQYTIGYTPTNAALDGSYRDIRITATGRGRLTVRTRRGYRADASLR